MIAEVDETGDDIVESERARRMRGESRGGITEIESDERDFIFVEEKFVMGVVVSDTRSVFTIFFEPMFVEIISDKTFTDELMNERTRENGEDGERIGIEMWIESELKRGESERERGIGGDGGEREERSENG